MSLYNMVCGNNPLYQIFHSVIETAGPLPEIPRYRDTYLRLSSKVFASVEVVIYTRTGGGNRKDYIQENTALQQHPQYIEDFDATHDSTFAHFVFSVPASWQTRMREVYALSHTLDKCQNPELKFKLAMDALEGKANVSPAPSQEELTKLDALLTQMVIDLGLYKPSTNPPSSGSAIT